MNASAKNSLARLLLLLVLFVSIQGSQAQPRASDRLPKELFNQPWRVVSMLADAGLSGRNILDIDFVTDKSSPNHGTVWIAAADGLHSYDGYHWRRFGKTNGLPTDFVRCVKVSRTGEVWVGTDSGAGVFDGKIFRTFGAEQGLAGPNVRRIAEDPDGTLWFCSDSWPKAGAPGGITSFRNGRWTAYRKADGLPSEYVVNYFRDSQGNQFVATLEGLAQKSGEHWNRVDMPDHIGPMRWSSGKIVESKTHGLMYSLGTVLFTLQDGKWKPHSGQLNHSHGICTTSDGNIYSCAFVGVGRHAIARWDGGRWEQVSSQFPITQGYTEDIATAPDGSIWVIGHDCLFRWQRTSQWREFAGINTPVFEGDSGRIWFSSLQNEFSSTSPVWFQDEKWSRDGRSYRDLFPGVNGLTWGWDSNHVTSWRGTNAINFQESDLGFRLILSGMTDRSGQMWCVGLDAEGMFASSKYDGSKWITRRQPKWDGWSVVSWPAKSTNGIWILLEKPEETFLQMTHFGDSIPTAIPIPRDLLSLFKKHIHSDTLGNLWAFGESGLFRWQLGTSTNWTEIKSIPGKKVIACVQRGGELWFACDDSTSGKDGLAKFLDGQWYSYPTEGILSLSQSSDGTILAGSVDRFYMIPPGSGSQIIAIHPPQADAVEKVLKAKNGTFWVGTKGRTYRFTPARIPPETEILMDQENVIHGQIFKARAFAVDRFLPKGTDQTHRFSWRLDGAEWSEFLPENSHVIDTSLLKPGHHTLEARAEDAGMEIDPTPALATFQISPVPMQSRSWFVPAIAGIILLLSSMAAVAGQARWKLAGYARSLETKVAERTAELNRDIASRERIETALRESETRWMFALEGTGDGIWDWNIPAGHVVRSPNWGKILGYSVSEIGGKFSEWEERIHPDDLRPVQEKVNCLLSEPNYYYHNEHRIRCKDGSYKWVLSRGKVMTRDASGSPVRVIGTISDISMRKEAEAELRETRERFAKAFRANPAILAISTYPEGVYLDINPAFTEQLGYSREEVMNRRSLDIGIWHDPNHRATMIAEISRGGVIRNREGVLRTKSGSLITVLSSVEKIELTGRPCLMFINYDITERKHAEATLRLSEERFRQLAENIREVFWISNPEKTEVIYVSPAYEQIWGRSCEQLYSAPRDWIDAIHPEDRDRIAQSALKNQIQEQYDETYRIIRPDGSVRFVHDRSSAIRDETGKVFRIVGIAEDMTDRLQLERQVRESQKLEALGTLAGGIAHDFNNILGAMMGNLTLARLDVDMSHPARESLEEIHKAGERAKNLVQQILAFSRQQETSKKRISLASLISEVSSLLRAILPAGIELQQKVCQNPPTILADANQIHQVLMNLCTNSSHAMDAAKGRITIELSSKNLGEAEVISNPGLRPGPHASLVVEDDGHGMDESALNRIFEPFFTTKSGGKGTGLGLAVVHGIVRSHDGAIIVKSQVGVGTKFEILLPAVGGDPVPTTPSAGKTAAGTGQRILYLDDEAPLINLATRTLRRLGYTITPFTNPQQALSAFKSNPLDFDLIITDFNMPGSNGLDFVQAIRQTGAKLPVILNSGYLTEELMERARSLGIGKVLSKPATLEEFANAIHEVLGAKSST